MWFIEKNNGNRTYINQGLYNAEWGGGGKNGLWMVNMHTSC